MDGRVSMGQRGAPVRVAVARLLAPEQREERRSEDDV